MLLFSSHPTTKDDVARYQRICEAYLTVLNDSVAIEKIDPTALQMLTVWPRSDLTAVRSFDLDTGGDAHKECVNAVSHYAYAAAYVWQKKFEKRGAQVSVGAGPYLVAWAQDRSAGKSVTVLTLDLSGMDSRPEIENAFHLWAKKIEGDPRHWQGFWKPADWQFYVASELNSYGQGIINAIAIVKHAGFIG